MTERVLAFGEGGRLVGTACLPDPPAAPGRIGLVLFNAGIIHRIGPHRINVKLARRLAAKGIPSLRFDLSGLGDSGRAPGSLAFEEQAVRDLGESLDALAAASGVTRFALFGFCSGGRHAWAFAPRDARVAGVILYDTFAFHTPRSRLRRYGLRLRRAGLVAAVAGRLRRLARRFAAREGPELSSDGSFVLLPDRDSFATRARELLARGTGLSIMHSGEGDNYNYGDQFRDAFRGTGIEEAVSVDYFPAMDHTVMEAATMAAFLDRIEARLFAFDAARPAG